MQSAEKAAWLERAERSVAEVRRRSSINAIWKKPAMTRLLRAAC